MRHKKVHLVVCIVILLGNSRKVSSVSEEKKKIDKCSEAFSGWKNKFCVEYSTEGAHNKAFENFQENYDLITHHNDKYNKGEVSYKLGLWDKADKNHSDICDTLNALEPSVLLQQTDYESMPQFINGMISAEDTGVSARVGDKPIRNRQPPESRDWTYTFPPVGDQGYKCGSCWTFTSSAAIASHYNIRYNKTIHLSEQYLVDCVPYGCKGGHYYDAIEYIRRNGIIDGNYSYTGVQGICPIDIPKVPIQVIGFIYFPTSDEEKLKTIVGNVGPVAVGVDGTLDTFLFYETGIYYDERCTTNVNHAVIIVGYGTENETDYWLIRNSWGESWGDNGYGKIARNRDNHCGIANDAMYPIVKEDLSLFVNSN